MEGAGCKSSIMLAESGLVFTSKTDAQPPYPGQEREGRLEGSFVTWRTHALSQEDNCHLAPFLCYHVGT